MPKSASKKPSVKKEKTPSIKKEETPAVKKEVKPTKPEKKDKKRKLEDSTGGAKINEDGPTEAKYAHVQLDGVAPDLLSAQLLKSFKEASKAHVPRGGFRGTRGHRLCVWLKLKTAEAQKKYVADGKADVLGVTATIAKAKKTDKAENGVFINLDGRNLLTQMCEQYLGAGVKDIQDVGKKSIKVRYTTRDAANKVVAKNKVVVCGKECAVSMWVGAKPEKKADTPLEPKLKKQKTQKK